MRAASSLLLVTCLAVAACGGGGKSDSTTTTSAAAPTTVSTFGGVPGAAQRVACQQSVQTLQQASDLYAAEHGAPARTIDDLAVEQNQPNVNAGYTITYDAATGHVGATGACTIP